MSRRIAPFDIRTAFTDPVTPLTLAASDVVQMGGEDVVLDLGPKRTDAVLVLEIDEIEIASNNELYSFLVQGSNAANFGSGVENLAIAQFGATEVRLGGGQDSVAGRYYVPFATDFGPGDGYKYVRLNVIIAGTIETGVKFRAWVSVPQV